MPPQGRGGRGHQPSVMDIFAEIVHMLSEAKLLPDAPANMQAIQAIEQGMIELINAMRHRDIQKTVGGGQGGPQGPPGMGGGPPGMGGPPGLDAGPPGGGPGGPGGMPGGPGSMMGSPFMGMGTPNPDELRRTLAGPARAGAAS